MRRYARFISVAVMISCLAGLMLLPIAAQEERGDDIVVRPGEIGVVFDLLEGVTGEPAGPGTHSLPADRYEVTIYSTRQQTAYGALEPIPVLTSDGLQIELTFTIVFRINPDQVNAVHSNWGMDYREAYIRPVTSAIIRDVVAQFPTDHLFGDGLLALEAQLFEGLAAEYDEQGFVLTSAHVQTVTFPQFFLDAVEQVVNARQDVERAQIEVERARIQARGQAEAAISLAEGQAQSTIIEAQAKAEALRMLAEILIGNPELIQYEYIQALADNVTVITVPTDAPFLFDFDSLTEPDEPLFDSPGGGSGEGE